MTNDDPWATDARNRAELEAHPAYAAERRWDGLRRARDIFDRNADELIDLLAVIEQDPANQARLAPSSGDRSFSDEFFTQLTQRLHNYAAGLATLVDIAKKCTDAYEKTRPNFFADFTRRNDLIRDQPASAFLRDLRNFLVHVGSPDFALTINPFRLDQRLRLEADSLMGWDGWKSTARAYIGDHRDSLYLRDPVLDHQRQMTELHDWADDQFESLHGAEYAEFKDLEARARTYYEANVARHPRRKW